MAHRSYTTVIDQPAAGVDWSFVPSRSDWARLLSITALLTTNATSSTREADVTITDETGNLLTYDGSYGDAENDGPTTYSWRSGSMQYTQSSVPPYITGSIPGFWLPPGATVASYTPELVPTVPANSAGSGSSDPAAVPATIVAGVSDEYVYTPGGGAGTPATYTITPGVYTTFAALQDALNAAVSSGSPFSEVGTWAIDPGTGDTSVVAVSDVGAAGNGNTLVTGAQDSFTVIFGAASEFAAFVGGTDAVTGDQWSNIVATYIVADKWHWEALEALLAQVNPGG